MSDETADFNHRKSQVQQLLLGKDKIGALKIALTNAPAGSKNDAIKESNTALVEEVLSKFTEAELSGAVAHLSQEENSVLMKYVYKLMAACKLSSLLLKLHAIILEKTGPNSIIKVLTDRKQV